MKKFLLIPALLFALNIVSQSSIQLTYVDASSVLSPNAVIQLSTNPSSNTKITVDIKNTSNATKTYLVKRYDVTLHAGADAYFCFAGNCYGPPTLVSPNPLTLTAGQTASQVAGSWQMLSADLDEAATIGYSLIKYTFINEFTASDSVQISLRYNSPVGLTEFNQDLSTAQLFPNPSNGACKLSLESATEFNCKLNMFDALGKTVIQRSLLIQKGMNNIELDLEGMNPGVYLVNLNSGISSMTRKLIVK